MLRIPFSMPEFRREINTSDLSLTLSVHKSDVVINLRSVRSWDIQGISLTLGIKIPKVDLNINFPLNNATVIGNGNTITLRMGNRDLAAVVLGPSSIRARIDLIPNLPSNLREYDIPYSVIGDLISSSGLVWPVMEYLDSIADIDMIIDLMNRYSTFIEPIINSAMNDPAIRQGYARILDNIQVMPIVAGRGRCSCQQ